MKDEIKEILKYIDQFVYVDQTYNDIKLSKIDVKLILDYITNLKEDIKKYVDVVLCQRQTIDNLQEEKERLHNLIVQHIDKEDNLIDYKSIIDKATEYIKSSIENSKPDLYNDDLDDLHILLNILQGKSDE